MADFNDYRERYDFLHMEREDGILELRLHTQGGPFRFSSPVHKALGEAFADIGRDTETRAIILTGTGDTFCTEFDFGQTPAIGPAMWDAVYREGRDLLMNLLDIEVPIIAAVNGPAGVHAELAVMSDIVLAAEHAFFQDAGHFQGGAVPGDGSHVIWPMLLGPNRGRYFLLSGEAISAQEAQRLGVVGEVLPADRLMPRARELARNIASKPALTARYTRIALVRPMKRKLADELGYGLALEGLAMCAAAGERH